MLDAETIKVEFKGHELILDSDGYQIFQSRHWFLAGNGRVLYLTSYGVRSDGTKGNSGLHRLLLNAQRGQQVDHINGNTFDNRRCNLRFCTDQENSRNSRKYKRPGATSQFKGVYRTTSKTSPWSAGIYIEPKKGPKHLGVFKTEIEAARAYDKAAIEHFGEYARLNLPEEHMMITVYCAAERVGFFGDDEQRAINAALDYSRDTERSVVIDYNDGTYQETWERRGEWSHGPIYRERKSDSAPIVTEFNFREAAE